MTNFALQSTSYLRVIMRPINPHADPIAGATIGAQPAIGHTNIAWQGYHLRANPWNLFTA